MAKTTKEKGTTKTVKPRTKKIEPSVEVEAPQANESAEDALAEELNQAISDNIITQLVDTNKELGDSEDNEITEDIKKYTIDSIIKSDNLVADTLTKINFSKLHTVPIISTPKQQKPHKKINYTFGYTWNGQTID